MKGTTIETIETQISINIQMITQCTQYMSGVNLSHVEKPMILPVKWTIEISITSILGILWYMSIKTTLNQTLSILCTENLQPGAMAPLSLALLPPFGVGLRLADLRPGGRRGAMVMGKA